MKIRGYRNDMVEVTREDYVKLAKAERAATVRMLHIRQLGEQLLEARVEATNAAAAQPPVPESLAFYRGKVAGIRTALELLGSKPARPDDDMPF